MTNRNPAEPVQALVVFLDMKGKEGIDTFLLFMVVMSTRLTVLNTRVVLSKGHYKSILSAH